MCRAQAQTAVMNGQVRDTSGAAIAGATVEVFNDATRVRSSTETNYEGIYSVQNLAPGTYHIQVSKPGFKTVVHPDITLNVQDAKAIGFILPVGPISDTVTVEGGAPLINTESGTVSTVVDRQFAENLPLNGRSFQTLLSLTPGVVFTPASEASPGQFSINGQRSDANYFTVDGVSANIGLANSVGLQQSGGSLAQFSVFGGTSSLVSVDALQEFRIQTSSFAPEFGRQPGGQISLVTRSGTNDFHGNVFDYFRNDVLDANDWFSNNRGLSRAAERQNDFGGTLGGPLLKDHLFFFFSYEGLRLRQPRTAITDVPSTSTRSAAPTALQPILAGFPLPNGPDRIVSGQPNGLAEFHASFSNPTTLDATSIRIDGNLNPSATAFLRFNHAPSSADQRGGQFASSVNTIGHLTSSTTTLTAGISATLSHTITNALSANYSYVRVGAVNRLDTMGGASVPPDSDLFPSPFTHADASFVLFLAYGLNSNYRQGKDLQNSQYQVNVVDNVSWTLNTHTIKTGVDYRRISPALGVGPYVQIPFFFSTSDVVQGVSPFVLLQSRTSNNGLLYDNFSLYAQDSWKTKRRLTLTYGFRWDVNPPPGERHGRPLPVLQNLQTPSTIALAPSGTPLYDTKFANFAPRLGIAYQVVGSGDHQLVLRGGVGLFYDLGNQATGNTIAGFPFSALKFLFGVAVPLSPAQAAPPAISASLPTSNSVYAFDPHLQLPRIYQWNAAAEQALGTHQVFSLTYAGAVGRRLLSTDTLANPNTQFSTVFLTRNGATSDFHSLQLQYNRRLSAGLQALGSYTWSHSIDEISDDTAVSGPNLARGSSDFDIRHQLTSGLTYELPKFSRSPYLRTTIGGWTLDSFFNARSSPPVDVLTTQSVLVGATQVKVRPNIVSGQSFYLYGPEFPGGKAINPNAFAAPAAGQPGDLGRNALRGFPLTNST